MTFNQLRIFSVVAKHLNITEASRELRISQPGVSRQLRLLEEECSVKLYRKNGHGIELSEEGHKLLRDSETLLREFEKIEGRFRNCSLEKRSGPLVIGGSHSPSASLLPSLLATFQKSHPEIRLNLRTSGSDAIEQLVLKSEVEIALITNPPKSPRIAVEPYGKEKILSFASVEHPLARRSMTLKDFIRVPLIIRQEKKGMGSASRK